MLYMIFGEDAPGSLDRRMANRPAHLQRAEELQNAGRMILGGPLPAIDSTDPGPAGFRGSLIVAEFDSLEDATAWAEADPYRVAGVWTSITVLPFRQVYPK